MVLEIIVFVMTFIDNFFSGCCVFLCFFFVFTLLTNIGFVSYLLTKKNLNFDSFKDRETNTTIPDKTANLDLKSL